MTTNASIVKKTSIPAVASSTLALCLAVFSGSSFAQVLEEVIVVAEKREQSLQDVPISIAVLSDDFLETRKIDRLLDVGPNVPNVAITYSSAAPYTVRTFIRGIGQTDAQITQDPSVALYMDGVYVGTAWGAGFEGVDLDRIEILRGPQGTLYGRNATGGAINVITRRANVDAVEFSQDLTGGNLGVLQAHTKLNVPISEQAAVKLNYLHSERDKTIENSGPGENFGTLDTDALILDARFLPTENFTIDYRHEKTKSHASQTIAQITEAVPSALTVLNDVSKDRLNSVTSVSEIEEADLEIDANTLFLTWELNDNLTVKSITAQREMDNSTPGNTVPTVELAPFLGGGPAFLALEALDFKQFSQELQLLGTTDSLEYAAGLYYYEDKSSLSSDITAVAMVLPTATTKAKNNTMAAFGQVTWTPKFMNERWHITAGGRYAKDDREATRSNPGAGIINQDYSNDFSNFIPTYTVAFDVNESTNVYVKIAEGYRSGGTSQRSANALLFADGFDEEEITNYEVGFKGEFWNGRARLNAALFYMELEGLQTSVQTGVGPGERDFLSVDGSTIKGGELDLAVALSESLRLSLNYGHLDSEIGESAITSPGGIFRLNESGPYTPEDSYAIALDYHVTPAAGSLDFNLNYAWQDDVFSSVEFDTAALQESYGLWGAALSWSDLHLGNLPGTLSFMLWGRNLSDEDYNVQSEGTAFIFLGVQESIQFGLRRNFGLTAKYSY